jgi:hypothetical protein
MMNYAIFLGIMNLILFSRLRLILRDEGISLKDMLIIGGIPVLVMPFLQFSVGWVLLLTYLLTYPPLMLFSEQSADKVNRNRGLFLLLHFVIIGLLSSPLTDLAANELSYQIIVFINQVMLPASTLLITDIQIAQIFIFGLLMVLNEANIILRYILQLSGLGTLGIKGEEVDQEEYSTGRIIGLLERIFVFLFVLFNQYSAIGFILAAKGVARFQDFKSRTFAEYVLIGTLLSALLAMTMAFAVKAFFPF